MLKAERHKYIMDKLVEEQKVNTINLALDLNISEDTIRRDLNELNRKGLLEKVYGGAFPIVDKPTNIFDVTILNGDKKNSIGNKALSLIHDGQVIIISGGTTNLAFSNDSDISPFVYSGISGG